MDYRTVGGGSKPPQTLFTDSLQRTTAIGDLWMVGAPDETASSFINPTISESLTGLNFANPTGGGSNTFMLLQPIIIAPGVLGKPTQFAEIIYVSNVGSFPAIGPCVGGQGDPYSGTSNGYWANIQPPNTFLQIRQANKNQRLVLGAIGSAITAGVKVRINVTFGASSNLINVFVNNVLQASTTDTDATRPVQSSSGLPSIFFGGCASGVSIKVSNFRGGLGLGG